MPPGSWPGLTGTDAAVITAIVSGLLAGTGIAAVAIGYLRIPHGTATQAAGLATVLAIAIILGLLKGIADYNDGRIKTADDEFAAAAERHYQLLPACTDAELRVNSARLEKGLEPLPPAAFCPLAFPTRRPRDR